MGREAKALALHVDPSAPTAATARTRRPGKVVFRRDVRFNGLKVFSATVAEARARLGEEVTAWIAAHTDFVIVEATVTQSSDAEFHCLAITIAYWQQGARK